MAGRTARDNILAGGFVVLGVLVAVWISFMLGQRAAMGGVTEFFVRFPMSIGAPGLKIGSSVLLGGQKVGRVSEISFFPGGASAPTHVDVKLEVPSAIPLYDNALIALDRPLLGSLSSINIADAGDAKLVQPIIGPRKSIDAGDIIPGRLAPPAFLAQAGIGTKEVAEIRNLISTLDSGLTKVSGVIDTAAPVAKELIVDAGALVADLKAKLPQWSASVDRIAADVEKASARLDPMLADGQEALAQAKAAIGEVQAIIADNKERVNKIAANLESATAKIDQTTVEQVNEALRGGREALAAASAAIGQVSNLLTEQTPNVRRTLANLRLMSDNLKLTAIEVRSQPWRALHAPTTKEVSTQALYDATRAYAEAASDVRAATESLAALTAGKPNASADAAAAALTEAMQKYQKAEQRLMDVLIREEGK